MTTPNWWDDSPNEPWIQTYSGHSFPLTCPSVEDFKLEDIAHHLSRINRFTGAIKGEHYSVAEHSCRVAIYARALAGANTEAGKAAFAQGLMHDAAESYLNDLSSPLKKVQGLEGYCKLHEAYEAKIDFKFFGSRIYFRDGVDIRACVKEADAAMCDVEKLILLGDGVRPWPKLRKLEVPDGAHELGVWRKLGWYPDEAEERFLYYAEQAGIK
jgi:uncharacterized protein